MCSGRQAFTLIELLVVVSIIALLMAMLLPSLKNARESARSVACARNLRSQGLAMHEYFQDNDGWVHKTRIGNLWVGGWLGALGYLPGATWTMDNHSYGAGLSLPDNVCPSEIMPNSLSGTSWHDDYNIWNWYGSHYSYNRYFFSDTSCSWDGTGSPCYRYRIGEDAQHPQAVYLASDAHSSNIRGLDGVYPASGVPRSGIRARHFAQRSLLDLNPEGQANMLFLDGHAETLAWPGQIGSLSTIYEGELLIDSSWQTTLEWTAGFRRPNGGAGAAW